MKSTRLPRLFLTLALLALAAGAERAKAEVIGISLGAPGSAPYEVDVPFTNLNGTALAGQMLSLEFVFTNWPYQQWLTVSNQMHGVLLMIQTDYGGGFIDANLPGTGYLLDISNTPISAPMELYYSGGWDNGGELSGSLYTGAEMEQPNPLSLPFSYYGVHFDFSLPILPDTKITDAQLRFVSADVVGQGFSGPNDQILAAGSNARFHVTGQVSEPIFYQWQFMGTSLLDSGTVNGSRTATLTLSNVQSANEGNYTVLITDASGTLATLVAELAVIEPGQTSFVVASVADSGKGSFRQAIKKANYVRGSAIAFSNVIGTHVLLSALPTIATNMSIVGLGPSNTVISGNHSFRVLDISSNVACRLANATIRDGFLNSRQDGSGAGIRSFGNLTVTNCEILSNVCRNGGGDGIWSLGSLLIRNSVISRNGGVNGDGGGIWCSGKTVLDGVTIERNDAEYAWGGGIRGDGFLTITNCIVRSNYGDDGTGGIYFFNGDLSVFNSDISGNSSARSGGGINFHGNSLYICGSTITNNYSYFAGGIAAGGISVFILNSSISDNGGSGGAAGMSLGGTITVSNCTISGNGTGYGGEAAGIENNGTLNLINCTVSGNGHWGTYYNMESSGIANFGTISALNCTLAFNEIGVENSGTFYAKNTIIADNFYGSTNLDFSGILTSQGFNLIGDLTNTTVVGDATGNMYVVDPLLGPLQDNGGPTWTHALLPGSPAIDAGNSGGVATDQRGVPRPYDVPCIPNAADGSDIGAYEWTPSLDSISQAVQRLMSEVSRSGLPNARPLTATLRAALASINRGDLIAAANQLHAFENKVSAQSLASYPVVAQTLIQDAQGVIDVVRCDGFASRVHSVKRHPDGTVQLNFSALTLQAPIVEASTNLVDWEVIGVGLNQGDGLFEFEDANAARFPHRFYRLVSP